MVGVLHGVPVWDASPQASNLNYVAGACDAERGVGEGRCGGQVCVYTLAATDIVVDVNGYVPTGGSADPLVPGRVLETRVGSDLSTVDGLFQGVGLRAAGSTLELPVAGRGGVPVGAAAVMLNVTAVSPGGWGS